MTNDNKTMIRMTDEELSVLADASDLMYGRERTVPRGAVVRRLCEQYINEVEQE